MKVTFPAGRHSQIMITIVSAAIILLTLSACSDRSPASLLNRGIENIRTGDYDDAIKTLETAARMASADPFIHANLGIAYWKSGRLDEAANSLNAATLLLDEPDEKLLHIQALVYMRADSPEKASMALNKANTINAENPVTHTYRAMVEEQLGRAESAIIHLDRALRYDPSYGPAIFNKAILLEQNEPERARRLYNDYLESAFTKTRTSDAEKAIARIDKRLAPPPPDPTPEVELELPPGTAESAGNGGEIPATVADSPDVTPGNPAHPDTIEPTGPITTAGVPDSTNINEVASIRPPGPAPETGDTSFRDAIPELTPKTLLASADRARENGNLDTALILIKRVMAAEPNNADAMWALAKLYAEAGQRTLAAATFRSFAERHPQDARAKKVAVPRPEPQPTPSTVPPAARSTVVIPASPQAARAREYYRLGVEAQKSGEANTAMQSYLNAIDQDPSLASAHYNLGLIYKDLSEHENAAASFRAALKQQPDMAKARYMLALVYRLQRNEGLAIDELKQIIQADAQFDKAYYVLALLHRGRSEPRSAISVLEKLLEITPEHRDAHYLIGVLYDEIRESPSLTRRHYERYLELAPTGPYANSAQAWLRRNR